MKNLVRRIGVLIFSIALTACATTSNDPRDPLEGFNRAMFSFNDAVDKVALKPAAKVYDTILPNFVQNMIGNFFGNLGDVWTMVNDILQAKGKQGASDFARVAINTTVGVAGLFDVASRAGLDKHKEDFGQTLGKWGVGAGPYIVMPIFGPSTLRDTLAFPVDWKGDLWTYVYPVDTRNVGTVVRVVDKRAGALKDVELLEDIALDRYQFVRDGYLQRREGQVHDEESESKPNKAKD